MWSEVDFLSRTLFKRLYYIQYIIKKKPFHSTSFKVNCIFIQNICCISLKEDLYICALLISSLGMWFTLTNETCVEMICSAFKGFYVISWFHYIFFWIPALSFSLDPRHKSIWMRALRDPKMDMGHEGKTFLLQAVEI